MNRLPHPSTCTCRRGAEKAPLPWLLPLIVILGAIFVIPIFETLRMSLTDMKIGSTDYEYTFSSYHSILTDKTFRTTLGTTIVFVFFSVLFQTVLGLTIALAVNKGERIGLHGTVAVRTISLISMVIPGAVIGIIWKMILDESGAGLLNYYFRLAGFGAIPFLSSTKYALISAVVANVWRGTAQSMILLYCGVKTIPDDVVEASMVDGADAVRRLLHIILPAIRNVLAVNVLLNVIGTFNTFDMIMSLTKGGPGRSTEVLALSVYNQIFGKLNMGRGCALAIILVAINAVMAVIYFRFQKKGEN